MIPSNDLLSHGAELLGTLRITVLMMVLVYSYIFSVSYYTYEFVQTINLLSEYT